MGVPATHTTLNLSGKFTMNKTLTDQTALDAVLKLQGIGMLKRTAAGLVAPTMCIRNVTDAAGVEHLEIEQGVSGGPAPKPEVWPLAWTEKTSESPLLGTVHGLIEAEMRGGDAKWTFIQIWGVEEINGERRHIRHARCTGPKGKVIEMKFVYDYAGPL
ncbi:hypothetical protein B0H17DRAFT_1215657 [Mycena rosella]|uniref:Uncharacterized protein n=1 Tax=Mycena rosella TaxID=1033263 RepID=A0AAD7G1B2_MYCRO|nr:hypothetical protein B0H17DRAFT_1215657 [Mycena rosella]